MPRLPRLQSLSDINHVMLRGIGHMDLFYENEDYQRFLNSLMQYKAEENVIIHAYCLMSNHVHLLLQALPDQLPVFFKRLEVSYALYFNGIHGHIGHLFQNRYKSEAVSGKAYFLAALRYILHNPEAAGICKWGSYQWSSANNYLTGNSDGITDISTALAIAGSASELIRYISEVSEESDIYLAEPEIGRSALSDSDAVNILINIIGVKSPFEMQAMEKKQRDACLSQLKQAGLSVRQLERITGINRNIIQRAR